MNAQRVVLSGIQRRVELHLHSRDGGATIRFQEARAHVAACERNLALALDIQSLSCTVTLVPSSFGHGLVNI